MVCEYHGIERAYCLEQEAVIVFGVHLRYILCVRVFVFFTAYIFDRVQTFAKGNDIFCMAFSNHKKAMDFLHFIIHAHCIHIYSQACLFRPMYDFDFYRVHLLSVH